MITKNPAGGLQLTVIQTALEFFQPNQHFTVRDIHSLIETGIAEGNPLNVRLTVNAPSQIAGVLRLWIRNEFWKREVKKAVGNRRLMVADEGARPLSYYWTGRAPAAKPNVKPVSETAQPAVESPAETITVPIHYTDKVSLPEVLFCEDQHMLLRIDGKLWAAKPFDWEGRG